MPVGSYPTGDVYDHESHAQFYYHAHPQELRGGQHGHFHTFLRANGIPDGMRPLALPDYENPADPNDDLTHLIAVLMNPVGLLICLFSTNHWVTGGPGIGQMTSVPWSTGSKSITRSRPGRSTGGSRRCCSYFTRSSSR
jgi:hypothetical protein